MEHIVVILRWVARSLSAILVLFHTFSFIGDNSFGNLTSSDILKLCLWGLLIVGLVIAWKWERTGSLIIFGVTLLQFIINPILLSVWVMWIAPCTGFLFYYCWTQTKKEYTNT